MCCFDGELVGSALPMRPERCIIWCALVGSILAGLGGVSPSAEPPANLTLLGTVTHPPIKEASALVASRRQAGVLWTLSDSRNPAEIYAIDGRGALLGEFDVEGGVNLDWESLAVDDDGNLFIADVGNNLRVPMRWIYRVVEPDVPLPAEDGAAVTPPSGAVRVEKAFAYTFPGDPFDVEGTFVRGERMYLVSKEPEHAKLWSLPITDSGPVMLTFVCDLPSVDRATGADINPAGGGLVICTYKEVILYSLSEADGGGLELARTATIPYSAGSVEGCCWRDGDVLLISEDRSLYSLTPNPEPALQNPGFSKKPGF